MKISAIAACLAISLLVTACAHDPAFDEGRALIDAGSFEAGLAKVEQAIKQDPTKREYQIYFYRQRDIALRRYLAAAEQARIQGDWEAAEAMCRRMIAPDADNARAKRGSRASPSPAAIAKHSHRPTSC